MKKLSFLIIVLSIFIMHSCSIYAMLTQTRKVSLKGIKRSSPQVVTQKRTLYTPEKLQGLYTNLPEELKSISPVHGVAKSASGSLQKIYAVESENPALAVKLVQALFHQQGQQFKPTENKSNAAYALNPGILGLVIGALEKNKLQDPEVRKYIINEWRAEYKRITAEKKPFSETKINNLLNIISDEYKYDKNNARSILLSFLCEKADLTSDHDMIHYLSGINHFFPVFVQQYIERSQKQSMSFFDKLRAFFTQTSYKPQDYAALQSQLKGMSESAAINSAMTENFELAIRTILVQRRNMSLYPPLVVRSSYGYQEKETRSNCVEAAMQDLFNILLYNAQTESFDLSLLPSNLKVNDAFKKFYEDHSSVNVINTKEVGQAFMNLVSDVPGIVYYSGNYELDTKESNFLVLVNYLLGTNASNLKELGKALSDERRTITFILHPADKNELVKINTTIQDNQTGVKLEAYLGLKPGHGELQVPNREKGAQISLLNPVLLAKNYNVSQEAQALFSIHPPATFVLNDFKYQVPASFYYIFNIDGDWNKLPIIRHILRYNIDSKEAVDYAYYLCKALDVASQIDILDPMVESGIWRSYPKFKMLFKKIKEELKKRLDRDKYRTNIKDRIKMITYILSCEKDDTEAIDYACDLCEQLIAMNEDDKVVCAIIKSRAWLSNEKIKKYILDQSLPYILKVAAENDILDLDLIRQLHEHITTDLFLADVLEAFAFYGQLDVSLMHMKVFEIAKDFIIKGADVNMVATQTQITPLFAAVRMDDVSLVELLLENGADPNMSVNGDVLRITYKDSYALELAIENNKSNKIIEKLIKYGANVNALDQFRRSPLDNALDRKKRKESKKDQNIDELIQILKNASAKTSHELLSKEHALE